MLSFVLSFDSSLRKKDRHLHYILSLFSLVYEDKEEEKDPNFAQ